MAKKGIFNEPLAPPPKRDNSSRFQNPWGKNFKQPVRDDMMSGNIGMGTNYGTGYKAPVGSFKPKGESANPIPKGVEKYDSDKIRTRN